MKKITPSTYTKERIFMFIQFFVIEKDEKINKSYMQFKVRYTNFTYVSI